MPKTTLPAPAPDLAVRPVTVLSQAIKTLRDAITIGKLAPGERLPEAELCRRMGISRATLREALRCLEAERLIEIVPNRGPSVARLELRDIEEIHEMWSILTTEAVVRFASEMKEVDIDAMRQSVAGLRAAIKTADVLAQLDATYAFFRVIYQRCDNRVWNEMITRLLSRIHFLRALSLQLAGSSMRCVKELNEIIAALKTGDAMAAKAATQAHIDSACLAAKRAWRQRQVEDDAIA